MTTNLDIISIGECLIELSTNENLTNAQNLNKYYGGDTLNTAVAAARLGSNVGFITKVGTDAFKDFLLDSWQSENIDTGYVKLIDGYNGLYIISRLPDGKKELAFYKKRSAAAFLSVDDIQEEYIESANIVYSTGITQSLSANAREAVKKAFSIANEKGHKVAYDPNFRTGVWTIDEAKEAIEEIIEYVDIIFMNSKYDMCKLLELTSPDKVIKYFWDRGVSMVVVKLGEQGSIIGYNGEINEIPACSCSILDTTGTGDAYNGAFLHGIVSGSTPFEAAKIASIVASMQARGLGAIKSIPYKEQVYHEFKGNES